MDGVLVDTENAWESVETLMLERFYGKEVAAAIGDTIGLGIEGVHRRAVTAGSTVSRENLAKAYEEAAMRVYDVAPLTGGVDKLVEKLLVMGFRLGIVSQSPKTWMDRVVPRLSFREHIQSVISLHQRTDLKPKPAPDGFLEALRMLDADASHSIILEDSNLGIESAKASGAFVIGFRGCLVKGYEQTGADIYADTMEGVGEIVTRQ